MDPFDSHRSLSRVSIRSPVVAVGKFSPHFIADPPPPPLNRPSSSLPSSRHRPGAILDFPIGGSQSFIDALVRGIQKHGGRVLLGAPVEQVVMEGGRATGVRLAGGKGTIRASGGVVCSTSVWDRLVRLSLPHLSCRTHPIPAHCAATRQCSTQLSADLSIAAARIPPPRPQNILPASVDAKPERDLAQSAPECASFVHLHVGFDATGLDLPAIGVRLGLAGPSPCVYHARAFSPRRSVRMIRSGAMMDGSRHAPRLAC